MDDYIFPSAQSDALLVAFGSVFYLVLMGPQAHNLSEVNNPCQSLELHSCACNGGL